MEKLYAGRVILYVSVVLDMVSTKTYVKNAPTLNKLNNAQVNALRIIILLTYLHCHLKIPSAYHVILNARAVEDLQPLSVTVVSISNSSMMVRIHMITQWILTVLAYVLRHTNTSTIMAKMIRFAQTCQKELL